MRKYHVKLKLITEILGTVGKDPQVYTNYLAAKANGLQAESLEQELSTLPAGEQDSKGWTGFHNLNGTPVIYDYVIKGFFKDACGMLRRDPDTQSASEKAFKKVIDGLIFIEPRQIFLQLPEGAGLGTLERPLRAETAQGPRVALARSESAPAGTAMEFFIITMGAIETSLLEEWLDYGYYRGLGQWRNGGYGRFEYEMVEVGGGDRSNGHTPKAVVVPSQPAAKPAPGWAAARQKLIG